MAVAVAVAIMAVAVAVAVVQSWGVLGCSVLLGGWVSWGCHGGT